MKCNYCQKEKHKTPDYKINQLFNELCDSIATSKSYQDYKALEYIRSQSFDKEDYDKMVAEYYKNGKLPNKKF